MALAGMSLRSTAGSLTLWPIENPAGDSYDDLASLMLVFVEPQLADGLDEGRRSAIWRSVAMLEKQVDRTGLA